MNLPRAYEIFNELTSTKFIDIIGEEVTVKIKVSEDYQCVVDDDTVYEAKNMTFTNSLKREQRRDAELTGSLIQKKMEEAKELVRVLLKITDANG